MSALFRPRALPNSANTSKNWAKIADRRSSPTVVRLRAGLFLAYNAATGAKEFDTFLRDANTWALFEHSVLPELENFAFVDRSRDATVSSPAVLADGMFHLWTVTDLGLDLNGRPTTIGVVGELAHYLCAVYEASRVDRRTLKRNWLGLNRR
jgi:hypothetical protein